MPDEHRTRSYWLLALLGTALFFLLIVHRLLMLKCVFLEDAWDAYWPWFSYLANTLGNGRFPLWDPHSSCGFPFHANPQAGAFYPVYVAVGWLCGGSLRVFQYLWLGHWLFGILGMFVLGKRLGLSPPATFVAAITFGFSGFFIGNSEHTAFINTASYIPWVLFVVDIAQERGPLHAMLGGVLLGMAGLAGYPGMVVYLAIMLAAWCLVKYGPGRQSLVTLALVFVVGSIVVAPAYGSFFLEAGSSTNRTGALGVKVTCLSGRFPLSAMISLIAPQFPLNYREAIDCDPSMGDGNLGVLGLMAVLLGTCACVFLWALLAPKANGLYLAIRIVSTQALITLVYLAVFGLYKTGHLRQVLVLAAACMLAGGDLAAHFNGNGALVCADGAGVRPALQLAEMTRAHEGIPFTGREKRVDAPRYHPNQGMFDRRFSPDSCFGLRRGITRNRFCE